MAPLLYVDLRCIEDSRYRVRGIGQHVAALLRTRKQSGFAHCKVVGLVESAFAAFPEEYRLLFDEITPAVNPAYSRARQAIFVDGSPMTHDARFSDRFLGHPGFFTAAIVYDFIPLDWPGYLPTTAHRIQYLSRMARLRKFDFFLPISEYTAWRTSELLGISARRMAITGASVRGSLKDLKRAAVLSGVAPHPDRPYFVVVVASDTRKNPEVVVAAVRQLNLITGQLILLKVVGHYDQHYKNRLLQLAQHAEGEGFLEFHADISDEQLVALYAAATATIAPSHIEGFSLPVVEAAVCGCPVIASTCAAQLELVHHPQALFRSDDSKALCERLEAIYHDSALRLSIVESQAHLAAEFDEVTVGLRFWRALEGVVEKFPLDRRNFTASAPSVGTKAKPRLAFLSPFPPDHSGVARYTAMAMRGGVSLFNSDLYSDAPRPLTVAGPYRDCGRVSAAPVLHGRYSAVISVLGNSHFHKRIFDVFERYGGPCILHDARLIQIYIERLGRQNFLALATSLLERPITMEEVHAWLNEPDPDSLFLEPIVRRAAPLMVHTVTQQAEIKRRYKVDARVITSCPTIFFSDNELTALAQKSARERLHVLPGTFLVSTFGVGGPEKGMETLLFAVDLLRSWNIPAELHFVGNAGIHKREIDHLTTLYGLKGHVHSYDHFVSDRTYREFLVASDVAVQLRTYAFGQLSAALTDCISAGLPTVASDDLATSCDSPAYVLTVPDRFSSLQVAEQLAAIWEQRVSRTAPSQLESRAAYLQTHNFEHYGKRLFEILELA